MINSTGSLVILSQNKIVVWSASSLKQAQNPVLQLLDSGNLVLIDEKGGNSENLLWESFDYPSDTLLPGMKHGWDLKTRLNRRLSASKSSDDPSPGDFTFGIELYSYPEAVMWKGSEKYYRAGPWNGLRESGSELLWPNPVFDFKYVFTDDEIYFVYTPKNKSVISRIVLDQSTYLLQRYTWIEADQMWRLYASLPRDSCDTYGLCGAYGKCIISESPFCRCLQGFKPKSQEKWLLMDWSQGCLRNKPLSCQDKDEDGFVKLVGLKLPDTTHSWVNKSMDLMECRIKCLNNCSCTAYTNSDIRGKGSGCALWFGDLIDIRESSAGGQDLYIRMPASELEEMKADHKMKIAVISIVSIVVVSGMLLVSCYLCRNRTNIKVIRTMKAQRKTRSSQFLNYLQ